MSEVSPIITPDSPEFKSTIAESAPASFVAPTGIAVRIPGEHFRKVVQMILKVWVEAQPEEARRFVKQAKARSSMIRQRISKIAKSTNWKPEVEVPVRVYNAIAMQISETETAVDWLADPLFKKIFFEEFQVGKMVKGIGEAR